jgi:drug/metabolite transporter (DMT)-like permease
MSNLALALILSAAFIHATWNLLNKRASGHATFTWVVAVLSAIIYLPVAAIAVIYLKAELSLVTLGMMAGSGAIHTAYFVLLNEGYRAGDLSLVYPLARGTGPLLASFGAILFLGERPSALALAGGLLIVVGVVALVGKPHELRRGLRGNAVGYALLTGTFIATYTLWDKQAVSVYKVAPILLDWGANTARTLFLTPFALRRWDQTINEWRTHRFEAVGIAFLVPLSYILVLTAMQFTPVTYIAPAREISILVGTVMGARLLSEGDARRRLFAAGAMVLGVVALAIG